MQHNCTKTRLSPWIWFLSTAVAILSTVATAKAMPNLAVTISDTKIPPACSTASAYQILAAVHDDSDPTKPEEEAVFLFCNGFILKYTLSTDTITEAGSWFAHFTYATALGVGPAAAGGRTVLSFQAMGYADASSIYQHDTSDLQATEIVGSLGHSLHYGVTLWNHADDVYVFGASVDVGDGVYTGIERFRIPDRAIHAAGELPEPRRMASGVWAPERRRGYLFGGITQGGDDGEPEQERSEDILVYNPDDESITRTTTRLPIPIQHSCAVWTGHYAYIICGGPAFKSEYNFIRFDPLGGGVDIQEVRGFDFDCAGAVCAFSESLNRVYVFGGQGGGNQSDRIMYIDLDGMPTEEPPPPTTTMTASTVPPSTTTTSPPDAVCSALDKYGVRYEAPADTIARNPCPGISAGIATWYCDVGEGVGDAPAFKGANPDYSNCTSIWLEEVQEIVDLGETISSITAMKLLHSVRQNILDSTDPRKNVTYFGHEIRAIFGVSEGILTLVEESTQIGTVEQLTEESFGVFDRVLAHASPWEELSLEDRAESATALLHAADNSALGLGDRFQAEQTAPRPYRKSFDEYDDGAGGFRILSGSEPVPKSGSGSEIIFPAEYHSYIEIPADWSKYFPDREFVSFSGMQLRQPNVSYLLPPPAPAASSAAATKLVNGPLMAFTFGGEAADRAAIALDTAKPELNFTGEGVRITFRHEVPAWGPERAEIRRRLHSGETLKAVMGSGICVYWDELQSNWSPEGCRLISSTVNRTVCECSHLTAFAVIMDLHDYVGKSLALEIMTWILCSASILCLVATIGVFAYNHFARRRRGYPALLAKHPRNELTTHLCVALLVAHVLILVTMDRHYLHLSDAACTASAMILHYALLVAFAWMALEGVLLAKLVFLDVFSTGREYAKLETGVAYLLPAIIVGVTSGVNWGVEDETGGGGGAYGDDAYCWLNGNYLWTFLGVVAVVLIFNTTVLAMAMRKSSRLNANPAAVSANAKVMRHAGRAKAASFWIRGALSLTVIMGLTWVAGFLMLIDNATVAHAAAYVFTASSASQGVFIFLFHVVSSGVLRARIVRKLAAARRGKSTSSGWNWRQHGGGGGGGSRGGRASGTHEVGRSTKKTGRRGTFTTLYS